MTDWDWLSLSKPGFPPSHVFGVLMLTNDRTQTPLIIHRPRHRIGLPDCGLTRSGEDGRRTLFDSRLLGIKQVALFGSIYLDGEIGSSGVTYCVSIRLCQIVSERSTTTGRSRRRQCSFLHPCHGMDTGR
jgi:hypothetical protein